MKYLAKYLPVEGHFHYVGAVIRFKEDGQLATIRRVGEGMDETKWEHMKLFLCSRDVGIDANIRLYKRPDLTFICMSRNKDKNILNLNTLDGSKSFGAKEKDCFKVIGPISPAATWVKEGDEFEESAVTPMYSYPVIIKSRAGESRQFILSESILEDYQLKELAEDLLEHQCNDCSICYGEQSHTIEYMMIKGPCGHFH